MSYSPTFIARVVDDRRARARVDRAHGLVALYWRAFHVAACREVAAAAARRSARVAA